LEKTESFKFIPSVGIRNLSLKKGEQYCIIPCTSEPKQGHFTLTIFAEKKFKLGEITKTWESVVAKKSSWKTKNAGGSPNFDSFIKNPQFLLTIPKKSNTEMIIDLVVSDEYDAIGFIVVKLENEEKKENFF